MEHARAGGHPAPTVREKMCNLEADFMARHTNTGGGAKLYILNVSCAAPCHHERKNGPLESIYKDVIFWTTNRKRNQNETNERLAGLETTPPCSPVVTAHPQDATFEIPSSGPAAINNTTPDVQHRFVALTHRVTQDFQTLQLVVGINGSDYFA